MGPAPERPLLLPREPRLDRENPRDDVGDVLWFRRQLALEVHATVHPIPDSSVRAATRSAVLRPSVNQPNTGSRTARAPATRPDASRSRATDVAARSSRDRACCWRGAAGARRRLGSAAASWALRSHNP